MKYSTFIKVVREFEEEDGLADVLYLEVIKKLRQVQENPQELNEKMARRIIRPFLACWGRMGRNVEREDFDWPKLVEAIKDQKRNLDRLGEETLQSVRLEQVGKLIREIYDGIRVKNLGPTGTSKIMHLLNPKLFMMWDEKIRERPFSKSSGGYLEFLEWVKSELIEVTKGRTIDEIRNEVDGEYIDRKTLVKLADEYCWRMARTK